MNIRIYIEDKISIANTLSLDTKRTHYLKNVLRINLGNIVSIFNEIDGEFKAEVISVSKKEVSLKILEKVFDVSSEVKTNLHVVFPIIKPHRLSLLIEKMTELGVEKLTPMVSDFTHNTHIKLDKLKSISIEACEQCERISLPQISSVVKLEEFLRDASDKKNKIFVLDERKYVGNNILSKNIGFDGENIFIVGPEGGFSEKEFELFKKYNVASIDLGKLILRTETACISIASIYNQILFSKMS